VRFVLFYHSLVSDWNHGNAHFLRGVVRELLARGHEVEVYEPENGWSLQNLVSHQGEMPLREFQRTYPELRSRFYNPKTLDLDGALDGADVAIVHEWSDHDFVARIGRHRAVSGDYRLLFHDTHHRCATDPRSIAAYDLTSFDGVLAFGRIIRDLYLENGWAARAWTWHEAADTHLFRPFPHPDLRRDVIWVGNWGDEERTAELHEFFLEPVQALSLSATVHGVRYPPEGLAALWKAGIAFGGWLPNFRVPAAFAAHRATVHIPRRPYREQLPGVPTIRVFEALACGIPLVSMPWDDCERLFAPGDDYLVVKTGKQMQQRLRDVLHDAALAENLASHGLRTIMRRHTCAHRVEELLKICRELGVAAPARSAGALETSPQARALKKPTHS
jgi:spore maturation protein CgeB